MTAVSDLERITDPSAPHMFLVIDGYDVVEAVAAPNFLAAVDGLAAYLRARLDTHGWYGLENSDHDDVRRHLDSGLVTAREMFEDLEGNQGLVIPLPHGLTYNQTGATS